MNPGISRVRASGSLAAKSPPCNRLSRQGFAPPLCRAEVPFREEQPCPAVRFSPQVPAGIPPVSCNPLEDDMAYDRYETRDAPRDERSRWQDNRSDGRSRGGRDDRGFFERAGDEVASWFGDEDAERRCREDRMRDEREGGWSSRDRGSSGRDYGRGFDHDRGRDRDFYQTRGVNERGGLSESDYNPS